MEREFLVKLGFNLHVTREEYRLFVSSLSQIACSIKSKKDYIHHQQQQHQQQQQISSAGQRMYSSPSFAPPHYPLVQESIPLYQPRPVYHHFHAQAAPKAYYLAYPYYTEHAYTYTPPPMDVPGLSNFNARY
jgi:hypothetical protein